MGKQGKAREAGFGLAEVLIYTALSSLLAAALYAGALTLQRSFSAAQHFVRTQSEQMRVLDYIALDARGAVKVTWSSDRKTLNLFLPDFYDNTDPKSPIARAPKYGVSGEVIYGTAGVYVPVSYYKKGTTIVRNVNGKETVLVGDVESFELTFPDAAKPKSIQATVSFIPKFRRDTSEALRAHNTASVTLLLRNKLG